MRIDRIHDSGIPPFVTNKDNFSIPRQLGKYEIESTYGESANPAMVKRAWQIHGTCYVDYGYFSAEALMDDDTLDPALDGTRMLPGEPFGVSYLLATPHGEQIESAEGGVRILDPRQNRIQQLPTHKYFRDNGTESTAEQIEAIAANYPGAHFREIAALSHDGDPLSSYELMRALIQNATRRKMESGEDEIFIAALTDKSLGAVLDIVGEDASTVIGDPVEIFQEDPRAARGLRVTAVLMEPARIIEVTMQRASASEGREKARLKNRLEFLVDGLEPAEIPPAVRQYLSDQAA